MQNYIILPQRFRLKMMRIYKVQMHNFRLGFERECPIEKIDSGCHHECAQTTFVSIYTNMVHLLIKKYVINNVFLFLVILLGFFRSKDDYLILSRTKHSFKLLQKMNEKRTGTNHQRTFERNYK